MSKLLAVLLAVPLALASISSTVSADARCGPGMKIECLGTGDNKKPPPCRCVSDPATGSGSHGKAEIKKKNVPQTHQNKTPKD